MRSRCGNGPLDGGHRQRQRDRERHGAAHAAPRHDQPPPALARRSRCDGRRSIALIRYGTVKNQTNRLPTTTATTPAA